LPRACALVEAAASPRAGARFRTYLDDVNPEPALPALQYPTVRQYMTPAPCTIARNQPLTIAQRTMDERGIRHLPVLDGEVVVGVLSEHDLLRAQSLPGTNPTDVRVEEAMAADPYFVSPDTPIAEVALTLMERKIGSAIAMEDDRPVGVFTTIDALRVLTDLLVER
jgi:acetoin utilization protein AcuB